jgi:hypothetical protein
LKFFITLSKRTLGVILAVVIIFIILAGQIVSADLNGIDGSTNAKRMSYLKGIGLNADDSNVTHKDILIPENFNDVYSNYNALQKKSGFDLTNFRGKYAVLYTYSLNSEYDIHLIVYKNRIIGGDIAALNINGEMKPLTAK